MPGPPGRPPVTAHGMPESECQFRTCHAGCTFCVPHSPRRRARPACMACESLPLAPARRVVLRAARADALHGACQCTGIGATRLLQFRTDDCLGRCSCCSVSSATSPPRCTTRGSSSPPWAMAISSWPSNGAYSGRWSGQRHPDVRRLRLGDYCCAPGCDQVQRCQAAAMRTTVDRRRPPESACSGAGAGRCPGHASRRCQVERDHAQRGVIGARHVIEA